MINFNPSDIITWRKYILRDSPILKDKIHKVLPEHNTEAVLDEVLKFLSLISLSGKSLSPSLVVDLAWHEFILCTKLYHSFCNDKFGKYIHHTPGGDIKENQSKFKQTIQTYIKSYGEPQAVFWGEYAHEEWGNSQCGSCESK